MVIHAPWEVAPLAVPAISCDTTESLDRIHCPEDTSSSLSLRAITAGVSHAGTFGGSVSSCASTESEKCLKRVLSASVPAYLASPACGQLLRQWSAGTSVCSYTMLASEHDDG